MPYTVEENIARLRPQISSLREALSNVPPELRGDALVVEARLLPQFMAASSFPAALFTAAGAVPIGTRPDRADTPLSSGEVGLEIPTKTVYLALDDDLSTLQEILDGRTGRQSKRVRDDIRALDTLSLPTPLMDLVPATAGPEGEPDQDGRLLFESILHSRVDRAGRLLAASDEVVAKWSELVGRLDGVAEEEWVRTSGAATFVPVRLPPERVQEAARFNPLRLIQAMPHVRPTPEIEVGLWFHLEPAESVPLDAPLRVAVFDGGIDEDSPFWAGRARSLVVGTVEADERAQRHGALVTSAMIYGHVTNTTLPPPANVQIDHFATLPQKGYEGDLDMYWLLDVIEGQVRAGSYDVVTLCTAPNRIVTDASVDRWTSTLDNLSHEKGVLFVVAVGNNGAAPAHEGLNRIMVPADATNVLAVGAADAQQPRAARASYSAVGPGRPGAQLRPSGVAFGGTPENPFVAVDHDGAELRFHGTSCAAPLVTHGLADLASRIGRERVRPVTLRAFALHFAEACKKGHSALEVGLGHIRDDYGFLLDGPPNEAHILYAGSIARGEYIPLALPVPDVKFQNLTIRYTLVTSTSTNAVDSVDYTNAGLEIAFRPHANKYAFSRPGHKTVVLDTVAEATRAGDLLAQGYRVASEPATDSIATTAPKTEDQLRSEGKWDSVRAGSHTYRDAGAKVFRPRVDISHLARENGVLITDAPDLDWAMLVTLHVPSGVDLYDHVTTQYSVLTELALTSGPLRTRSA